MLMGPDWEIHQEEIAELKEELAAARSLLEKYIRHVGNCRGVDFLSDGDRNDGCTEFTDEEWAELQRLAGEIA